MFSNEPGGSVGALADVGAETARFRAMARNALDLDDAQPFPEELMQQALTSLVKLYAIRYEMGERRSPFLPDDAMPATAALIMATAMLRAVNVELFELGMWQTWSGH